MDVTIVIQLILFCILLILSGVFSSSETAFFSLSKIQLDKLKKRNAKIGSLIKSMLNEPRKLIVTILIGNELVNIAASNISASILLNYVSENDMWWVNICIMLPILLLIGEITPKTLAVKNSESFAKFLCKPIDMFSRYISPLRVVIRYIADIVITFFVGKKRSDGNIITEDMMKTLANAAKKEGDIDNVEHKYINNIFKFGNQSIKDIQTPKGRISFLSVNESVKNSIAFFKKTTYSRVPIHQGYRDNIVGILHYRDLLKRDIDPNTPIIEIMREPLFVPETMLASDLFHKFRYDLVSIALVIDEYGSVTGMITMEDILESIFGELKRSNRYKKLPTSSKISEDIYNIYGFLKITDFEKLTGSNINYKGAMTTIGGMLLHKFGKLPIPGDTIDIDNIRFKIKEITERRISNVTAELNINEKVMEE